jgi:hypothetical protein
LPNTQLVAVLQFWPLPAVNVQVPDAANNELVKPALAAAATRIEADRLERRLNRRFRDDMRSPPQKHVGYSQMLETRFRLTASTRRSRELKRDL